MGIFGNLRKCLTDKKNWTNILMNTDPQMWVPSHLQRSSRNPSHININYSGANSSNKSPLGTCRVEGFFAWFLLRIGWGTPHHSTWFPTNSTSMTRSWHVFFESVWGFQTRIWKSIQSDQPQGVYYPGHTWLMDFQLQDVHFSEQSLNGISWLRRAFGPKLRGFGHRPRTSYFIDILGNIKV